MFYGSKHGGVKIYFVIYLKKIQKQSHIETFFLVTKSCAHVSSLLGGMVLNAISNNISVIS